MFYSLSWEIGSEGSHIFLALPARGRESSPSTMCVSEASRLPGTSFSHRHTLPFPLWTSLSSEILLTIKLKSFWVRIRGLLLRCKVNTGKFSVKFSFGLKIWNSFAPLTFSSCSGCKHMETQCQDATVQSALVFDWAIHFLVSFFLWGPTALPH